MGRYDDITPEKLRTRLVRFSRLVIKLEERGTLLDESPRLLKLLGELRQMIFAHEVRGTRNLPSREEIDPEAPTDPPPDDPELAESLRVVREALERERQLQDELGKRLFPDGE